MGLLWKTDLPASIAMKYKGYDQFMNLFKSAITSHHQQNEDCDKGSGEPAPAGRYIALIDYNRVSQSRERQSSENMRYHSKGQTRSLAFLRPLDGLPICSWRVRGSAPFCYVLGRHQEILVHVKVQPQ